MSKEQNVSFQQYLNHIFDQIEKLKKEKSLTDQDIADALSISKSYYSGIKNNRYDLTFQHLEQVAFLLDISIMELINYDNFLEELASDECQSLLLLLSKELGANQDQIQLISNYIKQES